MKGYDVIVASTGGGNYMLDFFIDQNKNWRRQPIYSELTSLRTIEGKVVDVVAESASSLKETLDYLAVRESVCTPKSCDTRLVAFRDGKRVDVLIYRRGSRYFLYQKTDLLGLRTPSKYRSISNLDRFKELQAKCLDQAQRQDINSWCDETSWRELSSYTSKPDSVVQVAHLYDHDRAGTINLFPKEMVGYNSTVPGRHAGELFHEKDAFVGFWGASINPRQRIPSAVNASLAPTLYEHITGRPIVPGTDGWGFPSLMPALKK